jgi:hypothetical protein
VNDIDFEVRNEGTIFIFTAVTETAKAFAETAFQAATTWGGSYIVEHRYAADILDDLVNEEGFAVTLDGDPV